MQKRGLGRGLQALLPEADTGPADGVREIDIALVRPNPFQPRKGFDGDKLEELANSIREHGVVQPILVRSQGEGFEIVAGERRWRASRMAGLRTIPAMVKELSQSQVVEIALIENLQREDLNPIEEAEAYDRLIREFGLTQEDLARRLGKSRSQVANTLRLLHLGEEVRRSVAEGKVSMGHAKVLLSVSDAKRQAALAQAVAAKGLSVRETEVLLKREERAEAVGKGGRKAAKDPAIATVEAQLGERLGTVVRIASGEAKGRIEISFFGEDDLQRIIDLLLA